MNTNYKNKNFYKIVEVQNEILDICMPNSSVKSCVETTIQITKLQNELMVPLTREGIILVAMKSTTSVGNIWFIQCFFISMQKLT